MPPRAIPFQPTNDNTRMRKAGASPNNSGTPGRRPVRPGNFTRPGGYGNGIGPGINTAPSQWARIDSGARGRAGSRRGSDG